MASFKADAFWITCVPGMRARDTRTLFTQHQMFCVHNGNSTVLRNTVDLHFLVMRAIAVHQLSEYIAVVKFPWTAVVDFKKHALVMLTKRHALSV